MKLYRFILNPPVAPNEYEILIPASGILRIERSSEDPKNATEIYFEGGSHAVPGPIEKWREEFWPASEIMTMPNWDYGEDEDQKRV